MRDPEPRVIRLSEYRPPDWLIETVDLDVRLDPSATRVAATLKVRPNPNGGGNVPLILDGDELTLVGLAVDGEILGANAYAATPSSLTIHAPPQQPFALTIETALDPSSVLVETHVNGTRRQSGLTSLMIYPPAFLVRWISRMMTLMPGDVIATGTPAGVGPLVAGDTVEVSVAGVGVLRNPVHAAQA